MWRITLKPLIIFVCSVICALYLWTQTHPATAREPSSPSAATTCKTDITWVKQGDNHWQSETGITLKFYRDPRYNQVPSIWFWDGKAYRGYGSSRTDGATTEDLQNLAEAYALLADASPGEEINVTQQFLRGGSTLWRTAELPPVDPKRPIRTPDGAVLDYGRSPYIIHYLQRPADGWAIDRLMTHAQGGVRKRLEMNRDVYFIERGPFLPIFEGRFKQEGFTLWFSTYDANVHRTLSFPEIESGVPSTSEMNLVTLQAINSFFMACVQTNN